MKQNKKYKEIIKATSYKPIGSVLLRLCGVGFSVWNMELSKVEQREDIRLKKMCNSFYGMQELKDKKKTFGITFTLVGMSNLKNNNTNSEKHW